VRKARFDALTALWCCQEAVQRHPLRLPPWGRRPHRGRRHRAVRCAALILEPRPLLCLTECRRPYGRSLKVDLDGRTAAVRTRARRMRISMGQSRPNAPLRARVALRTVEKCAIVRLPDAALQADGTVCVCADEIFAAMAVSAAALPRCRPCSHHHHRPRSPRRLSPGRGRRLFSSARPVGSPADEKLQSGCANSSCLQSLQQMRVVPPYWAHSKVPMVLLLRAQPNFMTGGPFFPCL
jgi:hypothetical protein